MSRRTRHAEASVELAAPVESAFDYLDDHERLGSHMSGSSWMMGGSHMLYEFDEAKGREVGAAMRLSGRIMGIPLEVRSVVTERVAPRLKTWETVGSPRLLVIGPYRMGFEVTPCGSVSQVRVFIDYALPVDGIQWVLGKLLGSLYARWCVRSMASEAGRRFGRPSS